MIRRHFREEFEVGDNAFGRGDPLCRASDVGFAAIERPDRDHNVWFLVRKVRSDQFPLAFRDVNWIIVVYSAIPEDLL